MIREAEIRNAIELARSTPKLYEAARAHYATIAPEILTRNHDRQPGKLRASDAGRCVLQVYADMHGLYDLPETPKDLLRMDNGSLMGAWFASLLKIGIEHKNPDMRVTCEPEVTHDAVTGHVDALIERWSITNQAHKPIAVAEFKWSAWTGDWRGDVKPYQKQQSGKYAMATEALEHFVVVYYASSQERIRLFRKGQETEWIDGNYLVVHRFSTSQTADEVTAEYDRLKAALGDKPPKGDATEKWRCERCPYSKCERNPAHGAEKEQALF